MKQHHVVKHTNGWALKIPSAKRASVVRDTQKECIAKGRAIAKNQGSELFIHGRDGKIRERNSYGNDPRDIRG